MKEEEHIAARHSRAGVHLRRTPARAYTDGIGKRFGERGSLVATTPVDDDHLGPARPQRCECLERRNNNCGFVENRNDNGERRLVRHSAASFNAPPQLEPWPAVQPKQWPAT